MRNYLLIIALLIATNIITLFFINQEVEERNYYFLHMTGESENWKIENHKVIITPNTREEGSGMLTYKGDTIGDNSFKPTITFYNGNGEKYHLSGAIINDAKRVDQLGGGGGSIPLNYKPTIEDIESKYIIVSWLGKEERIELDVVGSNY